MPPLPAVIGVIRIDHFWGVGEDLKVSNRLFVQYSGTTPTNSSLATSAATLYAAAVSDLVPLLSTASALEGIKLTDLSSATGAVAEDLTATAGTRAGGILPAATSALVNFQIARRYRGGKPRQYWPFGVDSDLADNQKWTSGFITAVHSGFNSYFTALAGAGSGGTVFGALCNVQYYHGFTAVQNPITHRWRNVPNPVPGPITVTDSVLSYALNPRVGSQRRRNLHGS